MGHETKIKVLLALAGRDQGDVARASGISASTLSRAFKGERRLSAGTRRKVIETIVEAVMETGASDA